MSHSVTSVSVSDLVRMRLELSSDPWKLAVVQRDEVWDEHRVARLLDSILAGYPIGTLLICRTRQETAVLDLGSAGRKHSIQPESWQILDGQQRIIALATLFAGDKSAGDAEVGRHFFLNLSTARPEIHVGKRDHHIHQYIVWQTAFDDPFEEDGPGRGRERSEWLDLALFGRWLLSLDGNTPPQAPPESDARLVEWTRRIDPAFETISPDGGRRARERLERLLTCWFESWIPVQRIELGGPYDVLQVFSRANMEGVRTSAADIFFAGVKTEWRAAEETLRDVCVEVRILDRMHALRLLARLASYRLQGNDIIPLRLDRLKGDNGKALIREMERIAGDSRLLEHWRAVSEFLIEESGLGYGMRLVDRHLIDHVLGWTAGLSIPRVDPGKMELDRLVEYLFWGTALRLSPVFGDGFSRLAMGMAIERDGAFPHEGILQAVRQRWPFLSYRRSAIPRPYQGNGRRDPEGIRATVHGRVRLFLAVAQGIPFDLRSLDPPRRVDWDHIYPKARRSDMKWHGPDGTWRLQYHPDNGLVWRGGNLCALDSGINRHLRDTRPIEKMERIEEMRKEGELWPDSLFITGTQADLLRDTQTLLLEKKDVQTAMGAFRRFIQLRESRLWDVAEKKSPGVYVFRQNLFVNCLEK
jgi:hypothetical protein